MLAYSSYHIALIPFLCARLSAASPVPQTPTTTQTSAATSQPTVTPTPDESSDLLSRSNLYFLILGVAIICIFFLIFYITRRRRNAAKLHSRTTRITLERDLAAISESMYHSRTRSQGTSAGAMGSASGAWARENDRYRIRGGNRDRRMSGRTITPTTDADGLKLDVNEHGDAPPAYIKEMGDMSPNARTNSVGSNDGTLQNGEGSSPATPNEARGEIELHDMGGERRASRLPHYDELDASGITPPAPVHRPA